MQEHYFDPIFVVLENPEDWTFQGMKVYNYKWFFNETGYYVETFNTEDGQLWASRCPKSEWSLDIWRLAKAQGAV